MVKFFTGEIFSQARRFENLVARSDEEASTEMTA
jgi:hypothetical protein